MIRSGSDFSGVGAYEQALRKLGIEFKTEFACDMDKYARETFIANYGEPEYFPENVYDRKIPKKPLGVYMTSPPCQAFSLAGTRDGENDDRGILFYNSHEFIKVNKPRYFIFENVKGLLSDDKKNSKDDIGRTFRKWLDYLGGKSVNGTPIIFPHEESVPYHIYWKVLNSKDYGVPQNRERVFIVGIRDDQDNNFTWPKTMHLTKKLKDILEESVDEKYFLSDDAVQSIILNDNIQQKSKINPDIANTLQSPGNACGIYKGMNAIEVTNLQGKDINNSLRAIGLKTPTKKHNFDMVKIKSATKKGYEVAKEGDSVNFRQPESETRRGRVGDGVANTIIANNEQGVIVKVRAIRGRDGNAKEGVPYQQKLEVNEEDVTNTISTVQKDNVVVVHNIHGGFGETQPRLFTEYSPTIRTAKGGGHIPSVMYEEKDPSIIGYTRDKDGKVVKRNLKNESNTIHSSTGSGGNTNQFVYTDFKIRRLTPRECFRLMGFPDDFIMPCSDTQMYKQAGNSIVVDVLAGILSKLNLS